MKAYLAVINVFTAWQGFNRVCLVLLESSNLQTKYSLWGIRSMTKTPKEELMLARMKEELNTSETTMKRTSVSLT